MLTKIKSAASVQTSGLAKADIISSAKVSEHFGTTHGSINLEQTHSEKRNQGSSFSSTAHDLTSAPNTRDQDSLSHLVSREAALERPLPERDKYYKCRFNYISTTTNLRSTISTSFDRPRLKLCTERLRFR